MSRQAINRFQGFIIIGGVGFAIEALLIALATKYTFGLPAVIVRLFSFPCAVIVTWWLNRKYNFRSRDMALSEGWRYFVTQGFGAFVNLAAYLFCFYAFPSLAAWPIAALSVGASAGLVVNFSLSYLFVFRKTKK